LALPDHPLSWLKKIGLSPFLAPLIGTLGFLIILLCLFGALRLSLVRFEPDFPQYLDHIQNRLAPFTDAIQKSSASMDRLGDWMIEGNLATPLFLGRWLILDPIAILLAFLLWGYLWGVPGTLLAVPHVGHVQNLLRSHWTAKTHRFFPRTAID